MRRHEVLAAGSISGVLGGIVMMVWAMIGASMQDIAPEHPLAVIGETFMGPDALGSVPAKVAFGAVVHLSTAAAIGVFFAAIVPREFRTGCAMGLGGGIALFAMGVLMSTVVPWVNPGFRPGFQVIGGTWVIAHVLYGMALGTAPALLRWIGAGQSHAEPEGAFAPPPATAAGQGARTR